MRFSMSMLMYYPLTLRRTFCLSVFLVALSITASHAGINNYQNSQSSNLPIHPTPFESTSSMSSTSHSNDLFIEQPPLFSSSDFIPFYSPQDDAAPSGQTFAGFDDDFGDEEIGVIPVGDAVWFMLILSLGYIFITLRKYK